MLDTAVAAAGATQRRTAPIYANIAPHPGNAALAAAARQHTPMDLHPDPVAAAAAAATAAGEMFLLSATSSDQHNSASSDGLTPPFASLASPLDIAGLAAAATAAAEHAVATIGGHTRHHAPPTELPPDTVMMPAPRTRRTVKSPRSRRGARAPDELHIPPPPPHPPPTELGHSTCDHNSSGFTELNDYFPLTDFDIPRDDFGMFGALDLAPFEHSSNFAVVAAAATLPFPSHSAPQQSTPSTRGCSLDDDS